MKEEFLQYVWQYSLFNTTKLKTTKGESVEILKPGMLNANSGPDFLESQLNIDGQKWVGNIEVHLKSSDWYAHHHEEDANYDAVILHIVFEDDVSVFMKNNKKLPTLVLKNIIDIRVLNNYKKLLETPKNWIPCEKQISTIDSFVFNNWIEKLYFQRLEAKSNLINDLLADSKNDFEAVLFQLLSKNFGSKVNGSAFLELSRKIDFSIIRKEAFSSKNLSALLFGVAGFLNDVNEDSYYPALKKEYLFLKNKYNLKELRKERFQFFRMRPSNFPTIRLAQLASVYAKHQNLFSKIIEANSIDDFYKLFSVEVDEFWKTHYTFDKVSKASPKKITKSFVNLILINTVVPLKFVYFQQKGLSFDMDDLRFLKDINPEKNSIIEKFSDLGIKAKNAFESQALLELKTNFCDKKACLKCDIGSFVLKS